MNRNKLLAYALGPVGSAAAGLLTLPLMSWHFAGGDIGRIVLLQTAASLALIVLGLGLDQAYVREFHHCGGRQAALFKNLAWPPLLLGVAAATAVWLSAPEMPSEKIFGLADGTLSLLCLLFAAGLLPVRYLSLILRMQERALAFSFSQLLPKLLVLAVVAAVSCFGTRADIRVLAAVYAASQWAAAGLLLWQTRHECAAAFRAPFDVRLLSDGLKYGLPLALGGLIYWAFTSIDRWLLRDLAGLEELAVYSMAVSFGAAAMVFQSVFSTVWSPMVFKWVAQGGDTAKVAAVARQMTDAAAAIVCLAGLLSPAVTLLLPPQYAPVQFVLLSSLLFPLLYTLTEVSGIGIHVSKRNWPVPLISLAALLCNLLLLNLWIPLWGARGAAMATAVSFWLFFALKTELSARLWQPLPRGTLYGTTAACLAACLAYTACGDGLYPYFAAVWLVGLAALAWRYRRLAGRLKTRNNR